MIFFVSVGELTLYSNIHVHILDCITNALNLWHIAIFPALPTYIMICRHCITTGKSWWAFKKFTATLSNLLLDWKVTWPYGSRVAYEWMNSINTQGLDTSGRLTNCVQESRWILGKWQRGLQTGYRNITKRQKAGHPQRNRWVFLARVVPTVQ